MPGDVYSAIMCPLFVFFFFFSSRRRHTRCSRDWSSDVCSSDLVTHSSATGIAKQPTDRTASYRKTFADRRDRKSTRLNSSHGYISYAVFCLKKKTPTAPAMNTMNLSTTALPHDTSDDCVGSSPA